MPGTLSADPLRGESRLFSQSPCSGSRQNTSLGAGRAPLPLPAKTNIFSLAASQIAFLSTDAKSELVSHSLESTGAKSVTMSHSQSESTGARLVSTSPSQSESTGAKLVIVPQSQSASTGWRGRPSSLSSPFLRFNRAENIGMFYTGTPLLFT